MIKSDVWYNALFTFLKKSSLISWFKSFLTILFNGTLQVRCSISSEGVSIDIYKTSLDASETEGTSEAASIPKSLRRKVGIISLCVSGTCVEESCSWIDASTV